MHQLTAAKRHRHTVPPRPPSEHVSSRLGRIQLWGHPIAVDWAEPEVEVDEDTMASVKILYVRNLMLQTTEETIEKEFNSLKPGSITAHHTAAKL